jgi:hypothetical protein
MIKLTYIVYHSYPLRFGGQPSIGLRDSEKRYFGTLSYSRNIAQLLFWKPPKRHVLLYATVR